MFGPTTPHPQPRPGELSGLYYMAGYPTCVPTFLPQLSVQATASILSSVARTTLTQTFTNPARDNISELRYSFPLYDGVSVASFTCTVNRDRVITGRVYAKHDARQRFDDAKARGQTAGLLHQQPAASDVFTTSLANVPAGALLQVDIVVLGELKHDAETDGIRFTIPTHIAHRYGHASSQPATSALQTSPSISIVVDVELPPGSLISSLQSPSHPIAVAIGTLSTSPTPSQSPAPHLASASLSLGTAPLDKDFVLQVVATNTDSPVAILEQHPTLPNQRALMATLVPKFNLPAQRPEIVFVCDRSGSMGGRKVANLRSALQLFLKSLPLGVTFNVCGFGSTYQFLFPESRTYESESLETAMRYAEALDANLGGTEIYGPLVNTFERRDPQRDLEVILLTDGSVWDQSRLFDTVQHHVTQSQGAVRLFTLAIGSDASHSLVRGLARAGRGFSQSVGDNEMMDKKVVRMLKGALTPHIHEYALEVKYKRPDQDIVDDDDDFDLIDRVADLAIDTQPAGERAEKKQSASKPPIKPISLFDPSFDPDAQIESSGATATPADLPSLSIPKILQAPLTIPPLYPFNRTSVYLIMSPETGDKIPESVILRAESKYGPLELEIPVTTTTTGETIHQLAARNATHEMEEGRGWIFQAKEQAGNVLLKDAYKAQFAAMVEREAVRLGVRFQVAGKWCSFVAVEGDDGTIADTQPAAPPKKMKALRSKACRMREDTDEVSRDLAVDSDVAATSSSTGLFGGAATTSQASSFGAGGLFAMEPQSSNRASGGTTGGLFGSLSSISPAPPPSSGSLFAAVDGTGPGSLTGISLLGRAGGAETPNETKLQTIIRMQYFSGFWDAKKEVLDTIGVTEARFAKLLSTAQVSFGNPAIAREIVATTTAVIVFLRTRLALEQDAWDLVVEKALSWLEEFYGTREQVMAAIAEVENIMG